MLKFVSGLDRNSIYTLARSKGDLEKIKRIAKVNIKQIVHRILVKNSQNHRIATEKKRNNINSL